MKIVCAVGAILLCFSSISFADIDYLSDYNGATFRNDLNGIGQTFTATDDRILDASILVTSLPAGAGTGMWSQARCEIRQGLPGNFDGTSGNVLFTSSIVNFSALQQVGVFSDGVKIYDLKFSEFGFTNPLVVVPGQVYSLLIVDPGTTGFITYVEKNPGGDYDGGGQIGHNRSYSNGFWPASLPGIDLAFKVATPEPSSAMAASGTLSLFVSRRRKRRTAR